MEGIIKKTLKRNANNVAAVSTNDGYCWATLLALVCVAARNDDTRSPATIVNHQKWFSFILLISI